MEQYGWRVFALGYHINKTEASATYPPFHVCPSFALRPPVSLFSVYWVIQPVSDPLAPGRPSIPLFISIFLSSSSSHWHPIHCFQLIGIGAVFIHPLPNGIYWYLAPMVAGWEATVSPVFRPITLTSLPTHKESFEQPDFWGGSGGLFVPQQQCGFGHCRQTCLLYSL